MSQDDRFSRREDPSKTVVRPSPGGRKRQAPVAAEPVIARRARLERPSRQVEIEPISTPNQLTANAASLLMLVPKLRKVAFHSSVRELQERLIGAIGAFQNRSLQQGYSEEGVRTASYLICSLLDETILNTPWGSESFWGHDTLLVKFHQEAVGGEEFFPIVDRLMRRPTEHLDLLEFAYMCLSLGFEGKYRLAPNGLRALEELRIEVYNEIQDLRGNPGLKLSVNWQGLRDLRNPIARYVPLWVLIAAACLILVLTFTGFLFHINSRSDSISYAVGIQGVASLEEKIPYPPESRASTPEPPPELEPPKGPDFQRILSEEIRNKLVVVDGSILRLTVAFDSGKDEVRPEYIPLLRKIAMELKSGTSKIEVTGHTDNKPLRRTLRFPSNQALSEARAEAVKRILDHYGSLGDRITSAGRADRHPIADNGAEEGRAKNRRVDIRTR